jgi:hypothetical protein
MKAVKEGAAMLEGWLRKAGARAEFFLVSNKMMEPGGVPPGRQAPAFHRHQGRRCRVGRGRDLRPGQRRCPAPEEPFR